jgi:hypothetical protein
VQVHASAGVVACVQHWYCSVALEQEMRCCVIFLVSLALTPAHAVFFGNKQGKSNDLNDCKVQCDSENKALSEEVKFLNKRVQQLEAKLKFMEAAGGEKGKPKGPNFSEGGQRHMGPEHCGPKTYRYKLDIKQDGPLPMLEDRMPQLSGDPPLMEIFGNDPGIEKGNLTACSKMTFFFHQWKNEESCKRCLAIVSTAEDWPEDGHTYSYKLETPKEPLAKDLTSSATTDLYPPMHAVTLPKPHNGERHYSHSAKYLATRDKMFTPLITNKKVMVAEVTALLRESGDPDWEHKGAGTALVMCSNDGHLSLLINFFCSLKRAKLR